LNVVSTSNSVEGNVGPYIDFERCLITGG